MTSPSKNDADLVAKSDSGLHPALPERRMRPVLWWASLGVAAVAIQAYIYTRRFFSDSFRAVGTGTDPVPTYDKVFAWILQPAFGLAALLAAAWAFADASKSARDEMSSRKSAHYVVSASRACGCLREKLLRRSDYVDIGAA
jgi:hypothetical protein